MGSGLEELGIVDDGDEPLTPTQPAAPAEPAPTESTGSNADELQRQLRKVTLFEGLLPVHLRRIASLVHEVSYKRGDSVFRHGDEGDGLYLIVEGSIRISRSVSGMGEEALAVLAPGMYFGEMSIVDDDSPRSADAIANEPARLLRLPKDDLRDLMFVDRELAYELLWRFVRTLSKRLRESNDRLLMLTVSSKF
ncbi:MAG: cyclic nucleotide-binding domain-containing protein [Myxococcota bacterium]